MTGSIENDFIQTLTWNDVRDDVKKVNEHLFTIIEAIDPNHRFEVFKIKYPFGTKIVDRGNFFIPTEKGIYQPIINASISNVIKEKLNYCAIPLALLLNKASEVFTETKHRVIPLQYLISGQWASSITWAELSNTYNFSNSSEMKRYK